MSRLGVVLFMSAASRLPRGRDLTWPPTVLSMRYHFGFIRTAFNASYFDQVILSQGWFLLNASVCGSFLMLTASVAS